MVKIMLCFYSVLMLLNVTFACAQAPSPDAECTNSLLSLINCKPFLAGTIANPTDTCCLGLGGLVKNAPLCLCGVLAGNPAFSSVNLTRALLLPDECDIPIDQGQCEAINAPPPKLSSNSDTANSPPPPVDPGSSASSRYRSSLACSAAGAVALTVAGATLYL